jgi:hypothetical protein
MAATLKTLVWKTEAPSKDELAEKAKAFVQCIERAEPQRWAKKEFFIEKITLAQLDQIPDIPWNDLNSLNSDSYKNVVKKTKETAYWVWQAASYPKPFLLKGSPSLNFVIQASDPSLFEVSTLPIYHALIANYIAFGALIVGGYFLTRHVDILNSTS